MTEQPDNENSPAVTPTATTKPQLGTTIISQDAKNLAVLNWLGTIFFGFIPGLLFYLLQKDDGYVQEQSKESLNWAITMMLAYVAAFFLTFIVIGVLLFPIIGLTHLVVCIMGVVATSQGKPFQVPFAIRLIK